MINHYLKAVFRNLFKNSTFSVINILGLAIGMAAFILIIGYISFEFSFDTMHVETKNIYRVESKFYMGNELTDNWATSSPGYAPAMKEEFEEIINYVRLFNNKKDKTVRNEEIQHREDNICYADSTFFDIFSYPLIAGNPQTALKDPNSVVISETAARKYFKNENPLNKILKISDLEGAVNCRVTGIIKDMPENSNLRYDFLISWGTLSDWIDYFWYLHEVYTYVSLEPGTNIKTLESKFPALAEKHKNRPALKEKIWAIELVPLQDIHLNKAKPYEFEKKGNKSMVYFMLIVAFIIIGIAWINYINLSIARSIERASETGIRKAAGAGKLQLLLQFLFESALLNFIAILISVTITQFFLPIFNELAGKNLFRFIWSDKTLWLTLASVFVTGVCASGFYPAFVLSSVKTTEVLKGKYMHTGKGHHIRKGLVIIQFAASVILITGNLVIYRQIQYMNNRNLGVNINETLVVRAPTRVENYSQKILSFKNELKKLSAVKSVSGSSVVPGIEVGKFLTNRRTKAQNDEDRLFEMLRVDYDFINAYNLEIIEGRGFSKSYPSDIDKLVLTESAVRLFGFENNSEAINSEIHLEGVDNKSYKVIGIVKDYHHQSVQIQYSPVILFMCNEHPWISTNFYSLKIFTGDIHKTIADIETVWNRFFGSSLMDYFFLDDFFNQQYNDDKQFGKLFAMFTSLAIFIACLGLWGLSLLVTRQRTKEIGIRKVHGAQVQSMVLLLAKDFLKLISIAICLGLPLSYLLINRWLDNYPFRISIEWVVFIIPVFLVILIAAITVGTQVVKTVNAHPMKSLRHE